MVLGLRIWRKFVVQKHFISFGQLELFLARKKKQASKRF
jgi:hypothetical protein